MVLQSVIADSRNVLIKVWGSHSSAVTIIDLDAQVPAVFCLQHLLHWGLCQPKSFYLPAALFLKAKKLVLHVCNSVTTQMGCG